MCTWRCRFVNNTRPALVFKHKPLDQWVVIIAFTVCFYVINRFLAFPFNPLLRLHIVYIFLAISLTRILINCGTDWEVPLNVAVLVLRHKLIKGLGSAKAVFFFIVHMISVDWLMLSQSFIDISYCQISVYRLSHAWIICLLADTNWRLRRVSVIFHKTITMSGAYTSELRKWLA